MGDASSCGLNCIHCPVPLDSLVIVCSIILLEDYKVIFRTFTFLFILSEGVVVKWAHDCYPGYLTGDPTLYAQSIYTDRIYTVTWILIIGPVKLWSPAAPVSSRFPGFSVLRCDRLFPWSTFIAFFPVASVNRTANHWSLKSAITAITLINNLNKIGALHSSSLLTWLPHYRALIIPD